MSAPEDRIVMEIETDPAEIARARARREQFERNYAWLAQRVPEIYARHRGQFICVAGQELFVGDTPEEALDRARAAHPEDEGRLIRTIPKEKLERIYAHRGAVARL